MAEGLLRDAVKGRSDLVIGSAGVSAATGMTPSPESVEALRAWSIDISAQRSRMLTPELVQQADYIFGMTHSHIDTVMMLYPFAAEKTFLLREFDETLDQFEKDISDPIGGSYEIYLTCRDQIEQGIPSLLRFIEHGQAPGPSGKQTNSTKKHAMFKSELLKHSMKPRSARMRTAKYLQSRKLSSRKRRPQA